MKLQTSPPTRHLIDTYSYACLIFVGGRRLIKLICSLSSLLFLNAAFHCQTGMYWIFNYFIYLILYHGQLINLPHDMTSLSFILLPFASPQTAGVCVVILSPQMQFMLWGKHYQNTFSVWNNSREVSRCIFCCMHCDCSKATLLWGELELRSLAAARLKFSKHDESLQRLVFIPPNQKMFFMWLASPECRREGERSPFTHSLSHTHTDKHTLT